MCSVLQPVPANTFAGGVETPYNISFSFTALFTAIMRCRFLAGALLWLSCSSLAASQLTTTAPYQTIGSRFGNQSLRVKSWLAGDTQLCPGAAAHHAGWADIDDQHLFFCT